MSTTILTSAWEAIILNISPVFTQPTAQIFINLITGWILCTTRRSVTGIISFAEPKNKRPHDAYHRLFPKSRWFPERQFIMGADGFYATLAGCGAAYTYIFY